MKKKALIALFLVLLCLPTTRAEETRVKGVEKIDSSTILLDQTYKDGCFRLKIQSYKEQKLVIYDLLQLFRNEEEVREVFELEHGENVVWVNASQVRGKAAIRLVTKNGSVAVVEKRTPWHQKNPGWLDAGVAAVSGTFSGFALPLAFGFYKKKKETTEPEKIL